MLLIDCENSHRFFFRFFFSRSEIISKRLCLSCKLMKLIKLSLHTLYDGAGKNSTNLLTSTKLEFSNSYQPCYILENLIPCIATSWNKSIQEIVRKMKKLTWKFEYFFIFNSRRASISDQIWNTEFFREILFTRMNFTKMFKHRADQ